MGVMIRRLFASLRDWIRGTPDVVEAEGTTAMSAEPAAEAEDAIPAEPEVPPPPPAATATAQPSEAAPASPSPTPPPTPEETAAAQSILDNESLTADLDDAAANELLEWGVANARMIARNLSAVWGGGSEISMSEQMRALRGMMRSINQYVAGMETSESALEKIVEQASKVYGANFAPPSAEARAAFVREQTNLLHNPVQLINNLRRFIEERTTGGKQ